MLSQGAFARHFITEPYYKRLQRIDLYIRAREAAGWPVHLTCHIPGDATRDVRAGHLVRHHDRNSVG
jgi:hypothetical protein